MHGRVADNTVLAHTLLARLELRLDECNHLSIRRKECPNDRQHLVQRDKCHVNGGKIQRCAQHLRRHIADIRAFHIDDTRIRAQLPVELPIADVDRKHLCHTVLKHTVCKAARRRADIRCRFPHKDSTEDRHTLFQFQPAAADIGKILAHNAQHGIHGYRCARLVDALLICEHLSRHDEPLGTLPTGGKSLLHEQDIQPLFLHIPYCFRFTRYATSSRRKSASVPKMESAVSASSAVRRASSCASSREVSDT